MLALSVSKDGGLMIDLCKYAPLEHYRYGVADVPGGVGSWNAPNPAGRGALGPGHEHCFSFIARHPFAWRKVAPRKSDLVFTPSQPPTTITVAGFIGSLDDLRHEAQPENP